jgi:hypothetical protein
MDETLGSCARACASGCPHQHSNPDQTYADDAVAA